MQIKEIKIRRHETYSNKSGLYGVVTMEEDGLQQEIKLDNATILAILRVVRVKADQQAKDQASRVAEAFHEDASGILLLAANGEVSLDTIPA